MIPNKSAETRFQNNQIDASRRSMGPNLAAQMSLRKQTSESKSGGKPLTQQSQTQPLIQPQSPVTLPTGGPRLPPEQTEGFSPEVFKENILNEIIGTVRTQEFIESPQVKDALTSVTVKNFFNATNPDAIPDNRSIFQKIVSRLQLGE